MKVYVLMDHDEVIGVFSSREKAREKAPKLMHQDGSLVSQVEQNKYADRLIEEKELDG